MALAPPGRASKETLGQKENKTGEASSPVKERGGKESWEELAGWREKVDCYGSDF